MYQHRILCILVFRCGGVVETTKLDCFPIDDDELVMHDRVLVVDAHGNTLVREKGRGSVSARRVALVHDDTDVYATSLCLQKCDGNGL
jgi:hypothetical protein